MAKKDYSRAVLEYANAASAMPRNPEPAFRMGNAFLAESDFANAIRSYRKAAEMNPPHERARRKLAELLTAGKSPEVLEQAVNTLTPAAPEDPDAADALAFAEWKLGRRTEAFDRLEETLRKFPLHLHTAVEFARLKLAKRDFRGAAQILEGAVAAAPESSPARAALGELYLRSGQTAKAEPALRKALSLDSGNLPAFLALEDLLTSSNRPDDAVAEAENFSRLHPDDRAARNRLFAVYMQTGREPRAREMIAAALRKNPKDSDALFDRAGLFMRDGKLSEAELDINQVLAARPDFAPAHLRHAMLLMARRREPNARQEWSEALRLDPGLIRARLALARSYLRGNEPKAALSILNQTPPGQQKLPAVAVERNRALLATGETDALRKALGSVPDQRQDPELKLQEAALRLSEYDYQGAIQMAEALLATPAGDLRAARIVADAYARQGQADKAAESLRAIAASHPKVLAFSQFRGQWHLDRGDTAGARQAFEDALRLNPAYPPAAIALADLDFQERRFNDARARLAKLVAAVPRNVRAQAMLGDVANATGDIEEAALRYRTAVAIDPSNVGALNNLAWTLAQSKPEEALRYARRAQELSPLNPAVGDTLAWIYYRNEMYSSATVALEKALAVEATPSRQYHLGLCYMRAGQLDVAKKLIDEAIRRDSSLVAKEKGW